MKSIIKRLYLHLCPFIRNDELYLRGLYWIYMGKKLNLKNPKLYQEKLQWLKLYDRKAIYSQMIDKVTAKDYASSKIGPKYIIPTLGVWSSVNEINKDELPNQFVLKTNNGGGGIGVIICKDKSTFDWDTAFVKLEKYMKFSVYRLFREWPYKNIKPCILAEPYMHDDTEYNVDGLTDYKFTCFNGYADNVMVCTGRGTGKTKFYFFNKDWRLLPLNVRGKNTDPNFQLPRPECIEEMFRLAEKLSEDIPFLRVDFYYINNQPYFGEMTFYPASGLDPNILPETEVNFGNKIILPEKTKE